MEANMIRVGAKVSWKSHGGTAHGTVEKKLSGRARVAGHTVAASKDEPQYVVRTDEGKKAAHKPAALTERK
jgi:hypothetical protein